VIHCIKDSVSRAGNVIGICSPDDFRGLSSVDVTCRISQRGLNRGRCEDIAGVFDDGIVQRITPNETYRINDRIEVESNVKLLTLLEIASRYAEAEQLMRMKDRRTGEPMRP